MQELGVLGVTAVIGAAAAVIAASTALVVGIIKFGKSLVGFGNWTGRVDADLATVKEGVKEVREDLNDSLREVKEDFRDSLREVKDSLRDDIKTLSGQMLPHGRARIPGDYAAAASPVILNDRGKVAAERLDARGWARRQSVDLLDSCRGLEEYQIYALCEKHVAASEDMWPQEMAKIAYEDASDVYALSQVLVIVLRDVLLDRLSKGKGKAQAAS